MKKFISLVLLTTTAYTSSSYDQLDTLTQKIQEVRLKKVSTSRKHLIEDLHMVDGLLDGTNSSISQATASGEERVKALRSLFQQRVVEKNFKKNFHKANLYNFDEYRYDSQPRLPFKRKLRSFKNVKEQHEEKHLKALYVMQKGVNALVKDPLLALKRQDFLKVVTGKIKEAGFEYLLTVEAFKILFPDALFNTIAPYAFQFEDCKAIQLPVMMGLAYTGLVASLPTNFMLNEGESYTFQFKEESLPSQAGTPTPLHYSIAVNYYEKESLRASNQPITQNQYPLLHASKITEEQQDFYDLIGFEFFEIGPYKLPKKNFNLSALDKEKSLDHNRNFIRAAAGILAQEQPHTLYLEKTLPTTYHLPSLLISRDSSVPDHKWIRGEQYLAFILDFSLPTLAEEMHNMWKEHSDKIENKNFRENLEMIKAFSLFKQQDKKRIYTLGDMKNLSFLLINNYISLQDSKLEPSSTCYEALKDIYKTKIYPDHKYTFNYMKGFPLRHARYSKEEYIELTHKYLPLLSNAVYRDEEYFLLSFIKALGTIGSESFPDNQFRKFYEKLDALKEVRTFNQALYDYLVALSLTRPLLKKINLHHPLYSQYNTIQKFLKAGTYCTEDDDYIYKLLEYISTTADMTLQSDFQGYSKPLTSNECISIYREGARTGHHIADQSHFLKELALSQCSPLSVVSRYENIFHLLKAYCEGPKTLRHLINAELKWFTTPIFQELFEKGLEIPYVSFARS